MTTFIYGYDPICGWCYGAAPALRAVAKVMPVRLVMSGLVTGERVGPAAAMETYVRGAAERLKAVTGRAPSEAFYSWMRSPGAVAASAPPAVAVHAVQMARPEAALGFAQALTEAHYADGMDPNDAYAAFAEGRAMGISSFPTFLLESEGQLTPLPTLYDPTALINEINNTK